MIKSIKHMLAVVLAVGVTMAAKGEESVSSLRANYGTTKTSWDAASGTLTFTSSGSINFSKSNHKGFIWDVPKEVKRIVINQGVTVNGAFHLFGNCTIEGKDRHSSVIYGTNEQDWAGSRNVQEWNYCQIQVYGGTVNIKNLTIYNPRAYAVRGWGPVIHMSYCDVIDDRGGWGNHSDGFSGGHGSTVDNCYFETGDDVIKCYFNIKVSNTTIKMVQNSVPFQFGWGTYQDSRAELYNVKVFGTGGRSGDGNPIFQWKSGSDKKTVIMKNCDFRNSSGTLFDLESGSGSLNLEATESYIQVKNYSQQLNASGTRKICGTTQKQTLYNCGGLDDGGDDGGGGSDRHAIPGTIQAEDYMAQSGIQTGNSSDAGGGKYVGWIGSGDWFEFDVDVSSAGSYTAEFRVAALSSNVKFQLRKGSSAITSVDASATGGWQTWKTVTKTVTLSAGTQTLRVYATGGGWNLNWMKFTKQDGGNDGGGDDGVTSKYCFLDHKSSGKRLRYRSSYDDFVIETGSSEWFTWEVIPVDGTWFYLQHVPTGKRLGSSDGKSIVDMSSTTTGNSAQWKIQEEGTWDRLIHRGSGKRLHIRPNGTMLQLGENTWTGDNTRWQLTKP